MLYGTHFFKSLKQINNTHIWSKNIKKKTCIFSNHFLYIFIIQIYNFSFIVVFFKPVIYLPNEAYSAMSRDVSTASEFNKVRL